MCKRLLMAAIIFFVSIAAKAEDQKIESKVQKVIVFLNGAQVTRTAMVNINAGTSTLTFGNISPGIDVQSIQVHAGGDFTILSVKHEMDYLDNGNKQKLVDDLQAKQKALQDDINLKNGSLSIYEEEANMLRKNLSLSPQNVNLDIVKLKQALDFQSERLNELKIKEQAINNVIQRLNIELEKYTRQIAEINSIGNTATSTILVTVSSKAALQSDFSLSYVVHNARWVPSYDIRAKNVNSPISISYKANVIQQSGEDWKNVKLTLSTGNPSVNSIKPDLNPAYLALSQISPGRQLNEVMIGDYNAQYKSNSSSFDEALKGRAAGAQVTNNDGAPGGNMTVLIRGTGSLASTPLNVNETENQTNVEFKIDNPYSIPADGKEYLVEIKDFNINASYQYAVVPKLSTDVFLTAQLTDWNKYNFLPGQANLYFEGTYIGKSLINPNLTADTLNLSLGVDKSIVVTRTSLKDQTERQSLGSNKKEIKDWQIEIKNRKNQLINLLVEDQVPISKNSSIDVETQQLSGGDLDKLTGKIKWSFSLKPQDDKKIELKYQVKYPKNQLLVVL